MDGFRFDLIPPGAGVLCALSGGADSMYLLCRLLEGREKYGWTVYAAHFTHGLRPAAQRDEDFVRDWCKRQGVPLAAGRADVPAFVRREGLSVEEGARILRYRFLAETAEAAMLAWGMRIASETSSPRKYIRCPSPVNFRETRVSSKKGSTSSGLAGSAPRRRASRPMAR